MILQQFGHYRITAKIGEGGMGVVYRALDINLNRPVAIKFLSDDLLNAAARRRFQREAQMASSLNHPHILTVHDVGEFEGRQYIVTEFMDGGTLREWSKSNSSTIHTPECSEHWGTLAASNELFCTDLPVRKACALLR